MVGLSPIWGKFISARNKYGDELLLYLQEHYAHTVIEMALSARFNWFWSPTSSSNDYFDWLEDMFERLDDFFSFEKECQALERTVEKSCWTESKEYIHECTGIFRDFENKIRAFDRPGRSQLALLDSNLGTLNLSAH